MSDLNNKPPARGYKYVDGQLVPMTEAEAAELDTTYMSDLEEWGDVSIEPYGLSKGMNEEQYKEHLDNYMPLRKHNGRAKIIIERIRDFFRRKPKHPLSEKTINRIAAGFWGAIAFCAIVFGFTQTIEVFFTVVGLIAIFSFVFGPLLLFWGRATRPPVKEKTEDDLYGKGWEARQKKLREVGKILEERDKREGK